MKAKIINFWWSHAHSLGIWWVILGIIIIAFGIYIVYDEGVGMIWEVVIGVNILTAGIKVIRAYNKREAKQQEKV